MLLRFVSDFLLLTFDPPTFKGGTRKSQILLRQINHERNEFELLRYVSSSRSL